MIAARLLALAVHALLHHDPAPLVGDDEAVEVEIEAVLHRGAVDLGDQPARLGERRPVETDSFADFDEFLRRLPRISPAAAADVNPEFAASGFRPRFNAPITLVVMPEECQSIPITAPNDWNQNGCARRRSNSSRP